MESKSLHCHHHYWEMVTNHIPTNVLTTLSVDNWPTITNQLTHWCCFSDVSVTCWPTLWLTHFWDCIHCCNHYHNNNEQLFWRERSETNKKEKLEKCRLTERKATINHLCLKILVHSCGLQILWSSKPLSVSPTSRLHSEKYIQTCTVCSSSYPPKDHCYRKFQDFLSWFSEDEMEVRALSASRS